jgi:hypothetical protein
MEKIEKRRTFHVFHNGDLDTEIGWEDFVTITGK